ncbi:hypothetical protein [Paraburkholderia aromaticivorans]|uniref:hypothetical protein n=1 Tax=Paraburkholderia aromaticivorans TaxID=2026199 RepID=UPI001F106768|nr:hypothetical protein [Paraburkholderia aromaticivorans]
MPESEVRTIGIRVAPKRVTFVVYDTDEAAIVNIEGINVPKAMDTPEQLKFVRNTILDVIREYGAKRAGIRVTEGIARNPSIERFELEGVIQEAFASSDLEGYFCGRIASIAGKLGIPREQLKLHLDGEVDYEEVENWMRHSREEREAIVTAIGAAHA